MLSARNRQYGVYLPTKANDVLEDVYRNLLKATMDDMTEERKWVRVPSVAGEPPRLAQVHDRLVLARCLSGIIVVME